MALTLAEVRGICRLSLAATTSWPDASLDRWIGQGVRFYSAHFPRRWRHELALEPSRQAYALPGGHEVVRVLSVEYPAGRRPAEYLTPVAEHAPRFETGGRYYALRGVPDDAADSGPAQIVFAPLIGPGEAAVIEYLGGHVAPEPGADDAVLSVPANHLEALTAYVEFCAQYELQTDAAVVVDAASVEVSQLGEQARRAWNRYKEVMDRLLYLATPGLSAEWVSWGDIGL